ncbi:MAG: TonB-dependent receptor [Lysobacterales bacterium]|jgi:iron complex outermembrane receptor protein
MSLLRASAVSIPLIPPLAFGAGASDARTDADEAVELHRMTVTGTRLKLADAEGALPVTRIDRETIDLSGESSLADFVRGLSLNTHGSYRSQMGTQGMGTSQVSLRGLGPERSLVLVDGRRLPKAPVSTNYQDLNTIPMGAVERIEVLSDGASAVYGSDAIGGVVNIITRDDYSGWELSYGRARTDTGGGDRDYGSVMFGHAGERWKLIATWSWNDRDITWNRDYPWYEPSVDVFGNNFTLVDPDFGFDYYNFTAIPVGCGDSEAYQLVPFPASLNGQACAYDYNRVAAEETSVGTDGLLVKFSYDIGPEWSAWLNLGASGTEAFGELAPESSWFNSPIPPDSPNNPTNPVSALYDPAFGPNMPVNYWHVFAGLGNYNTSIETAMRDFQAGMTGWLGRVELDFGIRFTTNKTEDSTRNAIDAGLAHAFVVDGTYDLQHPLGNPEAVLDAIRRDLQWRWDYDQNELFLTASWDQFEIGGAPVQWVAGGEYREEISDSEWPDDPHRHADRTVKALYFESLLPVTPNLEVSLAGRYDDYSDWGDNFAPKVSVRWRIADQLVLRASHGRGFRAPELAIPAAGTREGIDWTDQDPETCAAYGQPPGCWVPFHLIDKPGEDLDAEQSKQYSVGAVWQPSPHFSAVLDYYHITVDDKLQWIAPEVALVRDRLGASLPAGHGIERDPLTGALQSITSGWGNIGEVDTRGVDLTLNAGFGMGPGRWTSQLMGSYVIEDVWDGIDFAGLLSAPRARGTLYNRYDITSFTLAWNVRYIGSQEGDLDGSGAGKIPAWVTHDFQLEWHAPWNGDLAVGAQNAFNKQPVLDIGPTGYNRYNTTLYDAFGRILYARYTQTF